MNSKQSFHAGYLVDVVARQPRQQTKLKRISATARCARDRSFAFRHAIHQIHLQEGNTTDKRRERCLKERKGTRSQTVSMKGNSVIKFPLQPSQSDEGRKHVVINQQQQAAQNAPCRTVYRWVYQTPAAACAPHPPPYEAARLCNPAQGTESHRWLASVHSAALHAAQGNHEKVSFT